MGAIAFTERWVAPIVLTKAICFVDTIWQEKLNVKTAPTDFRF